MDRLAQPDKIDDYVKGVKSGRWMVILVVVLLALAAVSMAAYGVIHAAELSVAVESPLAKFFLEMVVG